MNTTEQSANQATNQIEALCQRLPWGGSRMS